MFIFEVIGENLKTAIDEVYGNPEHPENALEVRNAIYMKTADNQLVPWVASQSDILAEDWYVV